MRNIILSILLLVASGIALASGPHHAIIIDAGSSGSRLHLFEYNTDSTIPVINDIFSEKVSPGLASFESNPQAAGASYKKIVDDAMQQLASRHLDAKQVSISVMGTAGMRLLPDDKQQAIYDSITQYIKANYPLAPAYIGTISGKREGIYGWLDVNYLSHTFENSPKKTLGSLDMGGASTEIAFASDDKSNNTDEETLTIGGYQYTVLSMSLLGMGQDQALKSISNDAMIASCYPMGYQLSEQILGAFQLTECQKLYIKNIPALTTLKELRVPPKLSFVAYSGYYYAYHFLDATTSTDQSTVENKIQSICTQPWPTLKQQYPTTEDKYLSIYCANAVYMDYLLNNTYHLNGHQIDIVKTIDGKEIDWTLGAELYQLITKNSKPAAG